MNRIGWRLLALAVLLLCVSLGRAERYAVPLLVSAGASGAAQGVLRILNNTDETGAVEIYAIDDTGTRSGPASFTLNASAAVEFTAADLQSGNAMLGLSGGIGTGVGDARLELVTDLHIVPLAYVRAADGTLSAMHDTVRAAAVDGAGGHRYEVPLFNPASDAVQESRLRLINPGNSAASVTIEGRDDHGAAAAGGTVELTLAAGAARTLSALQLEAGDTGLTGRLGAGVGRWRLTVSSDRPIQVVNVVSSISGHMNNLSTTAVAGSAPVDHDAFNERFLGSAIEFRTDSREVTIAPGEVIIAPGEVTFAPGPGDTFTVTAQSGGVATTRTGRYGYAALGPDAGRMAVSYDDGSECAANLYFASRSAGWFANNCTAADDPDGRWLGGTWSVPDDADGGPGANGPDTPADGDDEAQPGSLGVCEVGMTLSSGQTCTYPGTADEFSINVRGRGAFLDRLAGIRIRINSETINGRVYDFVASHLGDGVWRIDRVAGRTEPPSVPRFAGGAAPGNLTFTVGTAIATLTLPEAREGNGTLSYALSPNVPGLTFDAATRELSGTPATAGTYNMTYTATDEDGDADSLAFAITVEEAEPVDEDSSGGDEDPGVPPPTGGGSGPSPGGGTGTLSPPPAPRNQRASTERTENSVNVRISWDPSPGATSYNVQRCATYPEYSGYCYWSHYWSEVASGITGTTWLDTTIASIPWVSPGDTVHLEYNVQACNSAGCSPTSMPHPDIPSTSDTPYTRATEQVAGHRTVTVRETL